MEGPCMYILAARERKPKKIMRCRRGEKIAAE